LSPTAEPSYNLSYVAGSNIVKYGESVFFQSNWPNRWLAGAMYFSRRRVFTWDKNSWMGISSWSIQSNSGSDGSVYDPKDGTCVRYGDIIYLKVNGAERWLRGNRGGLDERARTFDRYGDDPGYYQWIIRSDVGSGSLNIEDNPDPYQGACVSTEFLVYLQFNVLENRWLSGARSRDHQYVLTRDVSIEQYEYYHYEWMIRFDDSSDGSTTDFIKLDGPSNESGFISGDSSSKEDCENIPENWHNSDGPTYNCDWYGLDTNRCTEYTFSKGRSAREACCVCGGGSNICTDLDGWYDSDGPIFNCEWYSKFERCEKYGSMYSNGGYTANEACCSCKDA
jgi:hypothetical protein